jgi:hypothetical protein
MPCYRAPLGQSASYNALEGTTATTSDFGSGFSDDGQVVSEVITANTETSFNKTH